MSSKFIGIHLKTEEVEVQEFNTEHQIDALLKSGEVHAVCGPFESDSEEAALARATNAFTRDAK